MVIKLPATDITTTGTVTKGADKPVVNLLASLKKSEQKEIALLLPFNIARIESDTVRSKLLRSDKFLNMTLDFYAGALMAIDSARVLGLPLKVKILDSKESRTTSDVSALASGLSGMDVVIGPFFPSNVETLAAMLSSKNIPVISPLSKEEARAYPNMFQSVPTSDRTRGAVLEYLKTKNANVIAMVDAKKASSKQFIQANLPGVRFAPLNADGTIIPDGLKALLVKDKMNYVILETERLGMMAGTTKALMDVLADYQIQLVVLERYDAFDNDELPVTRLTSLKMLFPSVTNESTTAQSELFGKVFKEKNNIMPNQYATRGFDLTFDTILRLFQAESFKEVMAVNASEQVENKFAYTTEKGSNYNTGVYILYYDEDLTTKLAE